MQVVNSGPPIEDLVNNNQSTSRNNSLAGRIFSPDKVKWEICNFKPFKSAGEDGIFEDGIFPALLKKGIDYIYITLSWREVKVVFIPKLGKNLMTYPRYTDQLVLPRFFSNDGNTVGL